MAYIRRCKRCEMSLPSYQFGTLTDNNDLVEVPDHTCKACRHIEDRLGRLGDEARRRLGRWEPQNARYLDAAKAAVITELAAMYEQPSEFQVEMLAKLLVTVAMEQAPAEIDLRELFNHLLDAVQ